MALSIYVSTGADGSVKPLDDTEQQSDEARQNRFNILKRWHIRPEDTTLLRPTYDNENYCRYTTLTDSQRGDGILRPSTLVNDALVVTTPGHALLLPVADCIGAVIYDPVRHLLMMSHLGRQSLEQNGGQKSIEYLVQYHGSQPQDLQVWLSPAAGKQNYPLYSFEHRGLHDVATEQLRTCGVLGQNIDASPIDTTTDPNYFSHSEFGKGNRPTDGRFAVVAVID